MSHSRCNFSTSQENESFLQKCGQAPLRQEMQSSNTMLEVWSPSKQQQLLWTCSQTKFSRSWQKAEGCQCHKMKLLLSILLAKLSSTCDRSWIWSDEWSIFWQLLSHVVRDSSACVGDLWITVTEKWLRRIIWPAPTVPWGQRVTRCFPFALRKTARLGVCAG